ncbi:HsmA family protein [Desnuesiella massiliensis]|uniref:HsmA family protein n=1 Tax=Desnuesiella massiliensis TaxID=1650662 RepID=UPI0006E14896|nr:HsmA family protein [Desnuesiella massiliensis]
MLKYAVIFINLALVFYTIGVWSEKKSGELKLWHLIIFWLGLVFDTTGTTLMSKLANDASLFSFHGITGLLAIILMLFHAGWATMVLLKNNMEMKNKFHKFSIVVWVIWLVPFISGAIFAMTR